MNNKIISMFLEHIEETPVDLTIYKKLLHNSKITHKQAALYIGHTRETMTLWLLGKNKPPARFSNHIAKELDVLLQVSDMGGAR